MTVEADNPGVIARPPLLYAGALVLVLVLRWFWPMPIFADGVALWPGIALGVLGVGIAVWGRARMRRAGTNVDPTRPATAIVTTGPFRFTRNPLYLGITGLYLGLTLALNSWWGIAVLVPLLALMHFGVVLREERYLERKFGDDYRQYKSRVARYLPPL